MPQIGRYPENMRIGQLIDMMKNIRKPTQDTDDELIEAFALHKMMDKRTHALSGGTRQKVSAALAFLFHAPVLILDEPTAGLDPVSVEILREDVLRERGLGKSFASSSHILSDLEDQTSEVRYMYDGSVHFNVTIDALKRDTNRTKLSMAISKLIRQRHLIHSVAD